VSDLTTVVDTYLSMWNEEDATARAAIIERAWSVDGRYVDPLLEATGHAALSEMVAGVHAQFPGQRFRRTTGVAAPHDQVRFGWELATPDGTITVAGLDVGELDGDGRFGRIVGFFGPVPDDAAA
jgi:hypothetical protein